MQAVALLLLAATARAAVCKKTGAEAPAVVTLMASTSKPKAEWWVVSPDCKVVANDVGSGLQGITIMQEFPRLERIESVPSNLEQLIIDGCELSRGANLSGATRLTDISLNDGSIARLEDVALPPAVKQLVIKRQSITVLNSSIPLPPKLEYLDLSENPIAKLERIQFPDSIETLLFDKTNIAIVRGCKLPASLSQLTFGINPIDEFELRDTDFRMLKKKASSNPSLIDAFVRQTKCKDTTARLEKLGSNSFCVISDAVFTSTYSRSGPVKFEDLSSITKSTVQPFPSPTGGTGEQDPKSSDPQQIGASANSITPRSTSIRSTIIAVSIVGAAVASSVAFIVYRRRHHITRRSNSNSSTDKIITEDEFMSNDVRNDLLLIPLRLSSAEVRLTSVIAENSVAKIHRGTYRGRQVAVKRLLQSNEAELTKFMDEIRMCASLDHPKIVQFIGITWSSASDLSAVIEFMPGGDLQQLLYSQQEPSPDHWSNRWNESINHSKLCLALDIAEAINYLHSFNNPILHRDIRTKNVLLDRNGNAKLSDFGISRVVSVEETMTREVGSMAWIAPEVLRGERYSEKADIYSFGVLLVELDTHGHPYADLLANEKGLTNTELAVKISEGCIRPTPSSLCPDRVKSIISKCLTSQAELRPAAMAVFYELRQARRALECN